MTKEINLADQYLLTVEEAAMYFRIGENKIRNLVSTNRNAGYILWNGNRALIKRKKFEQYIDSISEI